MTGACARCDRVGRLFTLVALAGDCMKVCAECLDRRRVQSGGWGLGSPWAANKLPPSWSTTTLPAGPRGRR